MENQLEDQLERGEINEQQARHVLTILQDLDGELREAQQGSEQKQEETWEEQEQHAERHDAHRRRGCRIAPTGLSRAGPRP